MMTRNLLPLLLLTLAPACEAKSGPDGDPADDPANDPANDPESEDEVEEEPPADASREGEPCGGEASSAPCRAAGKDGLEFCAIPFEGAEGVWSACMVDACDAAGASRACEGGTQFCTSHWVEGAMDLRWGTCIAKPACEVGETRLCFPGEPGFEGLDQSCILDAGGVPGWDQEACNTPLVFSFGAPITYASAPAAAANFDMHGDVGVCVRADWPSAATPWLALDRDRSGTIDGGHELFGTGTRLAAGGVARNGFLALAELDSSGDGRISAEDARWGELVLWADHDGDRRSSGWEVLPLASFEIVAVELAYTSRRACDGAGNCGVERASFVYRSEGLERVGEVVDVHLACE